MTFLINLYNPNTETERVKTLYELEQQLCIFSFDSYKNLLIAGDFNCFFNSNLETSGGNPTSTQKSISSIMQLPEKYNLFDIWRIRNTFQNAIRLEKNLFSGYRHRRSNCIFLSKTL